VERGARSRDKIKLDGNGHFDFLCPSGTGAVSAKLESSAHLSRDTVFLLVREVSFVCSYASILSATYIFYVQPDSLLLQIEIRRSLFSPSLKHLSTIGFLRRNYSGASVSKGFRDC
jgi:hypothetical protein